MDLKQLLEPIPYKYRLQSAKNGRATIVSYIDSRQVQNRLDEVVGAENWQDDYKTIGNNLFCGIAINVAGAGEQPNWVTKTDVGTESNVDKEKGEVSDAFKRAAIKWGVGRFLYSLGIITLKTKAHTNGKEYPCKDDNTILWSVDDLTEYCKLVVESGDLDRTKNGVKPIGKTSTPVIPPAKTIAPKPVSLLEVKNDNPQIANPLQPSKKFNTLTDNKAEAVKLDEADVASTIKAFAKFEASKVLNYLIADLKLKTFFSVEEFIRGANPTQIKEVYNKFNVKK